MKEGQTLAPRNFWKERDTQQALSFAFSMSLSPATPTWVQERWILTWQSWALSSQDVRCCQEKCLIKRKFLMGERFMERPLYYLL